MPLILDESTTEETLPSTLMLSENERPKLSRRLKEKDVEALVSDAAGAETLQEH